jgi:hypothetical protein
MSVTTLTYASENLTLIYQTKGKLSQVKCGSYVR